MVARVLELPQRAESRVPPHDLGAEAAVISALIVERSPALVARVAAIVAPCDFFSEAHRRIFEAIAELHAANRPIDAVQVATWLRDRERLGQAGGMPYLTEVLNAAPAVSNVIAYARTVRSKARVRATIQAAQRIAAEGYAGGHDDADYLARSASAMTEATRMPQAEALKGNVEALTNIIQAIHRANATGSAITGLPTGLDRYDRMTLGLHARQLTIVAARPGMGKTSLGATMAANIARSGVGVLFFSLEMGREEILSRQLSALARIDGYVLRRGNLSPTQWSRLHEAARVLRDLPLWIDDRTGLTVRDIASVALGAIDEAAANKTALGCIVVDYLQKIAVPEDDRQQRYMQVGDIAKALKQLARDTMLPVVALAQIKRLGKTDKPRRPSKDDLRESGDIEQEADNIALLHADDESDQGDDPERQFVRELIIDKARGGRIGPIKIGWRPALTLFDNLPEGYGDDGY